MQVRAHLIHKVEGHAHVQLEYAEGNSTIQLDMSHEEAIRLYFELSQVIGGIDLLKGLGKI